MAADPDEALHSSDGRASNNDKDSDTDVSVKTEEVVRHEDGPLPKNEQHNNIMETPKKVCESSLVPVEVTSNKVEDQRIPEIPILDCPSPTKYNMEGVPTVSRRGRKRSPGAVVAPIPSSRSSSRRGRKRSLGATTTTTTSSTIAPPPPSAPPPVRSSPHWKNYIASLVHAIPLRPTSPTSEMEREKVYLKEQHQHHQEEEEEEEEEEVAEEEEEEEVVMKQHPQSPQQKSPLRTKKSIITKKKHTSQPYSIPEQATQEWKDKFEQLVKFKRTYGNCNVPLPWNDDGELGRWVLEQKQKYRLFKENQPSSSSTITKEQVEALIDIGVNLCSMKLTWQERFQQLLLYKERYGNCNVPQGWKENPSLAIWVNEQRKTRVLLEKGQKSCMTQSRIEELDRAGFEWSRNKLLSWEERFNELMKYKREHGHCNVPWSSEKDRRLYNWTVHQRVNGRLLKEGKKSNITQDRVEALDQLGFDWEITKKKGGVKQQQTQQQQQQQQEQAPQSPLIKRAVHSTATAALKKRKINHE